MEIGISPHYPTSPPLSPCSPDSGLCSPPSFQSPLHPSTLTQSVSGDSSHQLPRQSFEGYVARRSAVLKRWKDKKHITVVAGQQFLELKKHGKKSKTLHSFSVQGPNMLVEPLSADPKNDDFLGIRLINQTTKNELERFRMDDIVQMRQMMVALGSSGTGIFSSKPPPTIEAEEAYWASKTPQQAIKPILHYDETILQLPIEFYFSKKPSGIEIIPPQVGGVITPFSKPLPQCVQHKQPEPQNRRPRHDTFRPPLGPEVYVPLSMGYGEEVGLQKGQQAIWDPVLKACVVLNHNTKERINDDLRKPHKRPTEITKRVVEFKDRHDSSLKSKYSVCTDASALQSASSYARARPHAFELNACGRDGLFGFRGNQGACGADGHPGHCGAAKRENGCMGGNGWPGNPGTCGLNGLSGANASDIVLFLQGDSNELNITGSCMHNVKLGGNHNEEIMFVNCRGGDGGKGGDGGSGGRGGEGGAGGDGAPGEKGIDASGERRGGNGGPGGNGGCGGTGGTGGRGGDGGRGGNSGAGGTCIICATDPKLFILVEVDALSGDPGKGGRGGPGGPWGNGGVGGQGGPGGPGGRGSKVTQEFFTNEQNQVNIFGNDGQDGSPGGVGNCGQQGANGKDGSAGQRAPNGGIAWVVCSEEGTIVRQAGTRYDVQVKSYKIVCENDDGIYEPNEQIAISEVVLTNIGSLPLPAGAETLMENSESKTINFEPIRYKLPEIPPGESIQVPTIFYGRIVDQPPPNSPDRFQTSADFRSRVELLGRPFQKSSVPKKLTVQYPVRIKSLHCNENVGRGEVTIFEIEIENISTKAYGTCEGSAGEVGVHMHMDARLIPIAHGNSSEDKPVLYTIMYDTTKQDSLYIQVSNIAPKKSLTLSLAVQMASEAELFDYCQWQADLCLRGKVIEYKHEKIRISPIYKPRDQPGDILMITSPAISRTSFVLWERIFQILGATVDYWDTTRHNGLSVDNSKGSQHPNTWIGLYNGKTILFPHCNLQMLWGSHIVQHFHGKSDQRPDLGSGMLLLMPSAPPRGVKFDRFQDRGDVAVLQHLVSVDRALPLPKGGYGGKHMTAPNSAEPYLKWEQQTLEQKEKENPSFEACILSRQTKIESKGAFKYTYGEVDIRNCPLRRSCKFVAIDGAGGSISEVGADDPNVEKLSLSNMSISEIPLATNFGQVLLQTLYGLSISVKLNLIKGRNEHSHSIMVSLPNGLQLTLKQLSAICLAYEIADEVLGCSKTISRVNALLEDVLANKADYTSNTELMMQLINLTEKELQERKKKYDFSSMSPVIKETKKALERVKQAVRESNRRASNPSQNTVLPGLSILQNTLHVHHSHQHTVKDERWNLVCK